MRGRLTARAGNEDCLHMGGEFDRVVCWNTGHLGESSFNLKEYEVMGKRLWRETVSTDSDVTLSSAHYAVGVFVRNDVTPARNDWLSRV